jgi:hypothetical protein
MPIKLKHKKQTTAMRKKSKLFVDNRQPSGMIVLNWHGSPEWEFIYFAEAFHIIAKDAAAALRQIPNFGLHGSPIDHFRAYPIVFLYRHALELYMKAVIREGAQMVKIKGMGEINKNNLNTHNLDLLMTHFTTVFKAYRWDWDFGTPHFKSQHDFQVMIDELQSMDKKSSAFRYPIDEKGHSALPFNTRFNLFRFCAILDNLLPTLMDVVDMEHEVLYAEQEALAECCNME